MWPPRNRFMITFGPTLFLHDVVPEGQAVLKWRRSRGPGTTATAMPHGIAPEGLQGQFRGEVHGECPLPGARSVHLSSAVVVLRRRVTAHSGVLRRFLVVYAFAS